VQIIGHCGGRLLRDVESLKFLDAAIGLPEDYLSRQFSDSLFVFTHKY